MFFKFNGYSKSLCNNKLSSPIWEEDLKICEIIIFAILILYPNYMRILDVFILIFLIKLYIGGAYGSLWCAIANISALYYLYKY